VSGVSSASYNFYITHAVPSLPPQLELGDSSAHIMVTTPFSLPFFITAVPSIFDGATQLNSCALRLSRYFGRSGSNI
jgi:hypothetical protein